MLINIVILFLDQEHIGLDPQIIKSRSYMK